MRKVFVRTLWTLLILAICLSAAGFWAIAEGWIGYMPPIEDLQNPINRFATQVYSADGKLMGTWSADGENRIIVEYSALPKSLVEALVATEDERFYDHSGIDFYAVGRALIKRGMLGQASAGGGSTITQQLAKQLFSKKAHSTMERVMQKPIEWVIAVQLERTYTKDEIIALYLNYFDFLHNAVGIKTAANTYFNKEPRDLTVCESAMLVGLCKNPSYFNPVRNPDRCRERRNIVLGQMLKAEYITQAQYNEYSAEPIKLNFHTVGRRDAIGIYFREMLRHYMMAKQPVRAEYQAWQDAEYVQDSINWETDPLYGWCNKNHKRGGDTYDVYTDGLRVYTTLDSRMQRYAEEALRGHVAEYLQPAFDRENRTKPNAPYSAKLDKKQREQIMMRSVRQSERYHRMKDAGRSEDEIMRAFRTKQEMSVFTYHGEIDTTMTPLDSIRYYKSFLRCGFMSMCPQDGAVKAYVGGMDFFHFNYDMCSSGRRQVGSTIKPFLYSLAMENGMTPCDLAPNVQQTYTVAGQAWTPRNASRARYGQMVTLRWGLQQSNNWISAYLMSWLQPSAFVQLLRSYGINNPAIHPSLALCLGPCDVTVAEMVSGYTAFVGHGIRAAPMFVTKIEDSEGNVVARFQPRMNEVISAESADRMVSMLQSVVDGGTGGRLRFRYGLTAPLGGKTGTTNNNSDAWFIGFCPTLVSGVWVGGDDRDIHFDNMTYGQGASMALPIFAYYMKKVYADTSLGYSQATPFDYPKGFDPCQVGNVSLEQADPLGEMSEMGN